MHRKVSAFADAPPLLDSHNAFLEDCLGESWGVS